MLYSFRIMQGNLIERSGWKIRKYYIDFMHLCLDLICNVVVIIHIEILYNCDYPPPPHTHTQINTQKNPKN